MKMNIHLCSSMLQLYRYSKSISDVVWDYKEKIMHGLKASSGLENYLAEKNIFIRILRFI